MSTNCTTSALGSETLNSRVIKALFLGIIFIAALLLNVKTFLVLLKRKRQHRNVVTIFLLNLTLVSALMASQVPFNIHAIIEQGWTFGQGFCQFNGFSNVFLCMNLIFTLLCLTIDRYLAVVKPLRHRTIMTRRAAYRMLVVVYFLSFVLAVIPILSKARYKYHPGTNHCSPVWSNSCGYAAAMTTIAFILPIIGMIITYTRIFLTLRRKRVLMSKCSTSTMSSNDADSNSLGNFEDTSTDPSGDSDIRLTAHKSLDDLKDGLQPGTSFENLVEKKSATEQTLSKENFVKNAVKVCLSSDHLEEKGLRIQHTTAKRESIVENRLQLGSSSKQSDYAYGLESGSSNEHLAKAVSTVKDNKDEANTGLGDDNVIGTYIDVVGRNEESLKLQDPENVNNNTRQSKMSVDGTVNNFSLRMADKGTEISGYVAGIDETKIPRSELNVSANSVKGVTIAGPLDPPTTSTDNKSEKDEAHIPENKQVSFHNSTEASPSNTKVNEAESKRLSSIFPVSRRAIHGLVNRMKRQRAIRHEYKIARTGTILLLSFIVLWMPYVIAHLCFVGNCRTMTLYNIATFLVYTNSLANPIIYALTNRAVMQDIRKSMGKLCRSR